LLIGGLSMSWRGCFLLVVSAALLSDSVAMADAFSANVDNGDYWRKVGVLLSDSVKKENDNAKINLFSEILLNDSKIKWINVIPDHVDLQYNEGVSAGFTVFIKTKPTNPDFRIDLEGSFPVSTSPVVFWKLGDIAYYSTLPLKPENPVFQVNAILEDYTRSQRYRETIQQTILIIQKIQIVLEQETDPVKRQEYENQIGELNAAKNAMQDELEKLHLVVQQISIPLVVIDIINDLPVANFTLQPDAADIGQGVTFTSTSIDADGTIVKYEWDFGDGETGANPVVVHSYGASGTKTIRLTVTDNGGASSYIEKNLAVLTPNQPPVANFTPSATQIETGSGVVFTSTSTDPDGQIAQWFWNFGDGSSDRVSGGIVSHVFTKTGMMSVSLTVIDNRGGSHSKEITIEVTGANQPPIAQFSINPGTVEKNHPAAFTSTSQDVDGQIVTYEWNFGDGTTDTTSGPVVSHGYSSPGVYIVTLFVTDNRGSRKSAEKLIVVLEENSPPVAEFNFQPETPLVGEETRFSSGSTDRDGEIVSYAWDFGDGTTDTTNRIFVTHSYAQAGNYIARLTVRDSSDAVRSIERVVVVRGPNQKPVAVFSYSPAVSGGTVMVATAITFTSTSTDSDGTISKYAWDFGDNTVVDESTNQVSHTFATTGDYIVSLTVTDDREGTTRSQYPIKVVSGNIAPVAEFYADKSVVNRNETVTFTSESTDADGSIVKYTWDFGDGTTADTTNIAVTHSYGDIGSRKIILTVTDNAGSTGSKELTISVVENVKNGRRDIADPASVVIDDHLLLEMFANGNSRYIYATARNSAGNALNTDISWISNNPDVITVTSLGVNVARIEFKNAGVATITANAGVIAGIPMQITVISPPSGSFAVLSPPGLFASSKRVGLTGRVSQQNTRYDIYNDHSDGGDGAYWSSVPDWYPPGFFNPYVLLSPGNNNILFTAKTYPCSYFCAPSAEYSLTRTINYFDGRGNTLLFDGIDDVAWGNFSANNPLVGNSFSISLWMKPENISSNIPVISKNGQIIWLLSIVDGSPVFRIKDNVHEYAIAGARVSSNEWANLVVVYDATSSNLKLYQNGLLRSSLVTAVFENAGVLGSIQIAGVPFKGQLDELRIWNSVLTNTDIENELFNPAGTGDPRAIAFFSFDGPMGQTINDDSDKGHVLMLGSDYGIASDDPVSISASRIIATNTISRKDGGIISGVVGQNHFPGISPSSKIALEIPQYSLLDSSGGFTGSKQVSLEISDPQTALQAYSLTGINPISPVVGIHPCGEPTYLKLRRFDAYGHSKISIPFDVNKVSRENIGSVYGYRIGCTTRSQNIEVIRPFSVDYENGIATFLMAELGSIWVAIEKGDRPDIVYTSPQFSEDQYSSGGAKSLYTQMTLPGSGPYNITINGDSDGAYLASWYTCNNQSINTSHFPVTFQGIKGNNTCYLRFSKSLGWTGFQYVYEHKLNIFIK